ncbi:MAG: TonB-dependent receptor [Bryobacter sp.]|nr:TonB-dependent receptor [Bryobacter sp.]
MFPFRQIVLWLYFAALSLLPLAAQTTLGSAALNGTVTDDSGALIAGAQVNLIDPSRGQTRTTETNEAGRFVFPTIPAGLYTIRVTKDGFSTFEQTAFQIEVGQLATLNATMKLGQVSDVITVTGERQIVLETESNTVGTVVDAKRVDALPLNGRNFLQLALLSAGANEATGRANNADQVGRGGRTVIVAGNLGGATGYLINGIAVRGGRLGELAMNLSIASIDQFKIQQSFFMPDQGPNPGLINVTTKGGTNSFHGQAFWFVRNRKFDARNYFAQVPEDLKRNQYGGAVGGPIKKDKVWFYAHYEGLREITSFAAGAFTPTSQMFGGNFAEVPEMIYDPLTYIAATNQRSAFPNQLIPNSRINPVANRLLEYYLPGASLAQRPQNVFGSPRNTLDDDQWGFRIDYAISDRQQLYGQWLWQDTPAFIRSLQPFAGAAYPNETQYGMVQHTWTLSPTLVNTLRLGAVRNVALFSNEGRELGPIAPELGILNGLDPRGIPSMGFQEYGGFGRASGDLGNLDNSYQLDEGMNWIRGKHNFQFGASVRYRRTWQQNANAGAVGSLGFQRTFTTQVGRDAQGRPTPLRANSGNSFADFLLGLPTTGSYRGLPMLPYRFAQAMPYFQDTWKVTRNLTLNYGISYFFAQVPDPQGFARDIPHGFDETTGLLQFAALGQVDPRIVSRDKNNWTPRLGFAWQPDFLPRTVIRGGAGYYYADTRLIELQFAMVGPPFNDSVDLVTSLNNPIPVWQMGQNVFPRQPALPLNENYAASLRNAAPFLVNPVGRDPYMQQWNLSIQHSLSNGALLEFAYLGNSSHALQNRYDFNQCRPDANLRCDLSTRPYFPRYTSLLRADFNGNSSYNAFLTKFQQRMRNGLNINFEYTWARAITDTWEGSGATNAQITTCRACDKNDASFDVRHRAVLSAVYEVPFGRGRRAGSNIPLALDYLAGGWTLTTIASFQTGIPFDITAPNTTGSPFVAHRTNRSCSGVDSDLASNVRNNGGRYFDTSCFTAPATGFFGNSSRAPLHGPGIHNYDMGIHKNFTIHEQKSLQFRAELFNAFNHAQFGNPNGNSGAPALFGLIGSARQPRRVQFALKFLF